METVSIVLLGLPIFVTARLYSSVGQAGGSGYLAAMALIGLAPSLIKPTVLTLIILLATIAKVKFYRAGCFSWRAFWPCAPGAVPFAFIGDAISFPIQIFDLSFDVVHLLNTP
ncbi:MAG TPA: hypothetical protein VI758_12185 [Bacteroidota bacterium]